MDDSIFRVGARVKNKAGAVMIVERIKLTCKTVCCNSLEFPDSEDVTLVGDVEQEPEHSEPEQSEPESTNPLVKLFRWLRGR